MLKLSRHDHDSLRRHGEETYPFECCGILLGRVENDGTRVVTSTARCSNTRTDSAHNRYNIDPKELVRIQREGRERGEDIVGFYHSHPDHPARWSSTDLARGTLDRLLLRHHQCRKREGRHNKLLRTHWLR
jgi:proteasome lid subunit RPN8/RPN11